MAAMNRALHIAGNVCLVIGCLTGLPWIIAGALLHAQADKTKP